MSHGATLTALLAVSALVATCGALLGRAARRMRRDPRQAAARIDALLPQTQCGRCRYAGCRPYADAIARGEADINRCPPGGDATIRSLAKLLGRVPRPLDPDVGPPMSMQVAWIDESRCIGCARCLPACPVDAIVGAKRFMHTVIAAQCTGCELCLPTCPVDCIELRPAEAVDPRRRVAGGPLTMRLRAATASVRLRRNAALRASEARRRFERHERRRLAAAEAERREFDAARRRARGAADLDDAGA